jgi:hypothetical protein
MPPNCQSLRERYQAAFDFDLLQTDASGRIVAGEIRSLDCDCGGRSDARRLQAAEQTRYWGETNLKDTHILKTMNLLHCIYKFQAAGLGIGSLYLRENHHCQRPPTTPGDSGS